MSMNINLEQRVTAPGGAKLTVEKVTNILGETFYCIKSNEALVSITGTLYNAEYLLDNLFWVS